ncbi:hypothetical protein Hanom_Chr00s168386g01827791 [Helianthus anomalus]
MGRKYTCNNILLCFYSTFFSSKLQKSSFMYVTNCKLCPLSSIITENVLDVCKPLHVMSLVLTQLIFCG